MAFADLSGFVAVQHDLNLFTPADEMVQQVAARGLWSFCRQPLAMGLLTGKYRSAQTPFGAEDIRGSGADWMRYFDAGGAPNKALLSRLGQVRDTLTADGRSLAQGALGWCLAQSERCLPIPGCRTVAQVEDNFGVIEAGPLSSEAVAEIHAIMGSASPD